jgi:hypothetical protein
METDGEEPSTRAGDGVETTAIPTVVPTATASAPEIPEGQVARDETDMAEANESALLGAPNPASAEVPEQKTTLGDSPNEHSSPPKGDDDPNSDAAGASTKSREGTEAPSSSLPEQNPQSVASAGAVQENLNSMFQVGYTTGLDVDSNPTEIDFSDSDSAIGGSLNSSTYSTSSSVYKFVEENGRTYHRFKEGKYYLPNDEVSA